MKYPFPDYFIEDRVVSDDSTPNLQTTGQSLTQPEPTTYSTSMEEKITILQRNHDERRRAREERIADTVWMAHLVPHHDIS